MKKLLISAIFILYAIALHAQTPNANGVVFIKTVSSGNGNGSSWLNATSNLQGAVDASGVTQVWVAAGIYQLSGSNSYKMNNGVAIYGGFVGTETLLSARNSSKNLTTLKGNGTASVVKNNFSAALPLSNSSILDGFTITGGLSTTSGGGIKNEFASPVLNNIIITGNSATVLGGGIYNFNSSPILTNVSINGNSSQEGGGMKNFTNSSPTLNNVTISNNNAKYGGGINNEIGSSPKLTNVAISGNSAANDGGGLLNFDNSSPILTNVIIYGNSAVFDGGGIHNISSSSPTLTNVTISGNTAGQVGGGFYSFYCTPIIRNSIIFGNNVGMSNTFSNLDIKNSLIEEVNVVTNGNISAIGISPKQIFSNAVNYSLKAGSPALNTGDKTFFSSGKTPDLSSITTDLAGNKRIVGSNIDMGAYEFQGVQQSQNQTIIIDNITKTYGDDSFMPGATASSGLEVSYSSADNNIAQAYQDAADNNKWKIAVKKKALLIL